MSIHAIQIWQQLASLCREAERFYAHKYSHLQTNQRAGKILERGAADFDQNYDPNDMTEKDHYRTDLYVRGYMDMHLKQNSSVLKYFFKRDVFNPLLFIDFGCGPMTSGLALADILSKRFPDYRNHISYFGIDASRNMVAKAKSINAEYNLFAPEHFEIVQDTKFDSRQIPQSFPKAFTVVLLLSFVLAPDTYKSGGVNKLVAEWKSFVNTQHECGEVYIIYVNPKIYTSHPLHDNWHLFRKLMLQQSDGDIFDYTSESFFQLPVVSLRSTVSTEIIYGESHDL